MDKRNFYEVFVTFGSIDMSLAPCRSMSKILSDMSDAIRRNLSCGSHAFWRLYKNGNEILHGTVYKDYSCRLTSTSSFVL